MEHRRFLYLLDTARVNASTIVVLNKGESPKKVNSFGFGYDLARSFVLPLIYRRPRNGLNMPTLRKISFITGVDECQRKKQEAVEAATNYPVSSTHQRYVKNAGNLQLELKVKRGKEI